MRYESQRLASACEAAIGQASCEQDAAELRQCRSAGSASLSDVRLMARILDRWVHELMLGAVPLLPARAEKPAPHPDLLKRLDRLRAAQEDQEYARMLGSLAKTDDTDSRDAAEMSTYGSQIGVRPQAHRCLRPHARTEPIGRPNCRSVSMSSFRWPRCSPLARMAAAPRPSR